MTTYTTKLGSKITYNIPPESLNIISFQIFHDKIYDEMITYFSHNQMKQNKLLRAKNAFNEAFNRGGCHIEWILIEHMLKRLTTLTENGEDTSSNDLLQEDNDRLKEDNDRLQKENELLKEDNARLKEFELENARLKSDNLQLKSYNLQMNQLVLNMELEMNHQSANNNLKPDDDDMNLKGRNLLGQQELLETTLHKFKLLDENTNLHKLHDQLKSDILQSELALQKTKLELERLKYANKDNGGSRMNDSQESKNLFELKSELALQKTKLESAELKLTYARFNNEQQHKFQAKIATLKLSKLKLHAEIMKIVESNLGLTDQTRTILDAQKTEFTNQQAHYENMMQKQQQEYNENMQKQKQDFENKLKQITTTTICPPDQSDHIGKLNDEIRGLKTQIRTLTDENNRLKAQIQPLTNENNELKAQILTLNNEIRGLENLVQALKGEITTLNGEKTALETRVQRLTGEITTLNGEKTALETRVQRLTGEINGLKAANDKLTTEKTALNGEFRRLEREIADQNDELNLLRKDKIGKLYIAYYKVEAKYHNTKYALCWISALVSTRLNYKLMIDTTKRGEPPYLVNLGKNSITKMSSGKKETVLPLLLWHQYMELIIDRDTTFRVASKEKSAKNIETNHTYINENIDLNYYQQEDQVYFDTTHEGYSLSHISNKNPLKEMQNKNLDKLGQQSNGFK